jgi:hypothetical protein
MLGEYANHDVPRKMRYAGFGLILLLLLLRKNTFLKTVFPHSLLTFFTRSKKDRVSQSYCNNVTDFERSGKKTEDTHLGQPLPTLVYILIFVLLSINITFTFYFLLFVDMFRPHTAIFRCYNILSRSWCSVMPQRQHKYSNTRTLTTSTPPAGAP